MQSESQKQGCFSTNIRIRVGDINYGGHLGNDKYLLFFQEARVRFFKELGLSELNIGDDVSLTQAEAFISYKAEAFLGDILNVSLDVEKISHTRFYVHYQLNRLSDDRLIGTGHTILVGFDYNIKRPVKIPQSFYQKVSSFKKNQSSLQEK
jgi:acyl-CoA thioester hydrolase